MTDLQVRRRKIANVASGEPWIFTNALHDQVPAAGLVRVVDEDGRVWGWADFNPEAGVAARLLHRGPVWPGEREWLWEQIQASLNRRLRLGFTFQAGAVRMVNAEGDGLSGLIIDCYGRHLVIDFQSRSMRERQPLLAKLFQENLGDFLPIWRMGADAARREHCQPLEPATDELSFRENGVSFRVAMGSGQKTGFFIDQRDNRRLVSSWALGRKVLDLFAYQGAFSLCALGAGAVDALAVDASGPAIQAAVTNAEDNGLPLRVLTADVFDFLAHPTERGFDLVVCDPPKLSPARKDKPKALAAYRFLCDHCLGVLNQGGILLVASCSQAVSAEDLLEILSQLAAKRRVALDVLAVTGQPCDHPWPACLAAARYLAAVAVELRGPW